jgi:hypothetical protein
VLKFFPSFSFLFLPSLYFRGPLSLFPPKENPDPSMKQFRKSNVVQYRVRRAAFLRKHFISLKCMHYTDWLMCYRVDMYRWMQQYCRYRWCMSCLFFQWGNSFSTCFISIQRKNYALLSWTFIGTKTTRNQKHCTVIAGISIERTDRVGSPSTGRERILSLQMTAFGCIGQLTTVY